MSSAIATGAVAGWAARLELEALRRGVKSELGRRSHFGPLRVQKPFYPEGEEVVHVYLLHPPGGVVGGDRLEIAVNVRDGASLLVTTPAAQKLYRSDGPESVQEVELAVAPCGALEWLPAETIAFDGARARSSIRVELAPAAAFAGWEIGCFGRPANGIPFARGALRQSFEIRRAGVPLIVDRLLMAGGADTLGAPWGLDGCSVYGNLYLVPRGESVPESWLALLRAELSSSGDDRAVATSLDELVVVRVLARSVERARARLLAAWARLRPEMLGRRATPPRIWAT